MRFLRSWKLRGTKYCVTIRTRTIRDIRKARPPPSRADAIVRATEKTEIMSASKTDKSNLQIILNSWTKLGFTAVLAVLLGSWSFAQESQLDTSMREFLNNPDRPIVVKGDYLKALLVAYGD